MAIPVMETWWLQQVYCASFKDKCLDNWWELNSTTPSLMHACSAQLLYLVLHHQAVPGFPVYKSLILYSYFLNFSQIYLATLWDWVLANVIQPFLNIDTTYSENNLLWQTLKKHSKCLYIHCIPVRIPIQCMAIIFWVVTFSIIVFISQHIFSLSSLVSSY